MLLDKIKFDQLLARKRSNTIAASLLTTVIGEAELLAKNKSGKFADEDVVALLKKFISNIETTLSVYPDNTNLVEEKSILTGYLPAQLSEDELRAIIAVAKQSGAVTGKADGMKYLKQHYAGKYDGKLASSLF